MAVRAAVAMALLLVASGALAQHEAYARDRMFHDLAVRQQVGRWNERLQALLHLLETPGSGRARRAAKDATKLEYELLDQVVKGEGGCRLMGFTLFFRAVAEARLGETEAATWHWQMAQNVLGELRTYSFGNFPDVERQLAAAMIPAERWDHLERGADEAPESAIEPPTPLARPQPKYPEAALKARLEGPTTLEVILDETGVPRAPVIRRGCGAVGLDVAAMEAVREWRYTPARRDGRPVSTHLTVEVRYVLRRHG